MEVAKLPDEVKNKILVDQNFGVEHGVQLLRLKDVPNTQLEVAEKFVQEHLSRASELPEEVKKTAIDIHFGIAHGLQHARAK